MYGLSAGTKKSVAVVERWLLVRITSVRGPTLAALLELQCVYRSLVNSDELSSFCKVVL